VPRPKGLPKTGGRRRGSKNKRTVEVEKELAKAASEGIMPLTYLLALMRDDKAEPRRRDAAAAAAAPFCHARRASEDRTGNVPSVVYYHTNLGDDDDCNHPEHCVISGRCTLCGHVTEPG
jgi:hypothetical protein